MSPFIPDATGLDTYSNTPFGSDAGYAAWMARNFPVGAPPAKHWYDPIARIRDDFGLVLQDPLATAQGFDKGLEHGGVMIANAATFHQIERIDNEVDRLIAQNGGVYGTANVFGHVGPYALYAATGLGLYQAGPAIVAYGTAYAPGAVAVAQSPGAWALAAEVYVGYNTDWDPAAMAYGGLTAGQMASRPFPVGRVNAPTRPALPAEYWIKHRAPTQVTPGVSRTLDLKPSGRARGEVYERVNHYDEFGRLTGQTHRTHHGQPDIHPNPHHHRRSPITGENLRNPETGTVVWPGVHPAERGMR